MKIWGNIVQKKDQENTPEIDSNELYIYELPDREFKVTIIKMLNKFKNTLCGQNKNFNSGRKCLEEPNRNLRPEEYN